MPIEGSSDLDWIHQHEGSDDARDLDERSQPTVAGEDLVTEGDMGAHLIEGDAQTSEQTILNEAETRGQELRRIMTGMMQSSEGDSHLGDDLDTSESPASLEENP